jgi:hypothetical protein
VLLLLSCCISVLFQTERRIDRRSNQLDHWFVRCYNLLLLCFFQSSDACRNWTVGSSDGASWLDTPTQCTKYSDAYTDSCSNVLSVYRTVSFIFFSFIFSF